MATHDYLIQENAQLKQRLAERESQLQLAKQVHDQYRAEKQQSQDLLFACLHTLGPRIHIEIEHFHDYFRDAQFDGDLHMDDDGKYVVNLQFYQEGIEMHWRRKLLLGDTTPMTLAWRQAAFNEALKQQATPEEAYTLAINLHP